MFLTMLVFLAGPPPSVPKVAEKPAPPELSGPVRDAAELFSKGAREKAAARLAALQKEHGWELVIETAEKQVDSSHLAGVINTFERHRFIDRWAKDRAGIVLDRRKGLYVIITRHPEDVRVVGWPDETDLVFPGHKRERLRSEIRTQLRQNPDGALALGIDHWELLLDGAKLRSNPLETVPLLIVLGVHAAGWVVLSLARRQLYREGELPPLYPPAVQGGVLGTPAGLWITDRLFDSERPVVLPPSAGPSAPGPADAGGQARPAAGPIEERPA